MSRSLIEIPANEPDEYDDYITEDNELVDNLFTEKQQRLLTQPLYNSWDSKGRKFLVCTNVGIFSPLFGKNGIAPDLFLSMDVQVPDIENKQKSGMFYKEQKVLNSLE